MAAAAMKHMASSFAKLEKFEGVDFRRWQKKLQLCFQHECGGRPEMEGLILNGMSDSLFDIYQNVESSKEL
ncbi:hypothetical protein Tco_0787834 [Tanacetum coccineum]